MLPVIDLIASVGGLVVPPLFDFIKKKFIKEENDNVERTIGSLATTKPEVLPEYINALTGAKKAEVEFFNRDVVGTPSPWVIDLRASIRPATVGLGILMIALTAILPERVDIPPDIRYFLEVNISSWFGSKLKG